VRFTKGFHNRHQDARDPRLPPGQYNTGSLWPVLTAEVTPKLSLASWTFTVEGLVERETRWTWEEIHALPQSSYVGDIHCVSTWSKLGTSFKGVSVDTLLAAAVPLPAATHGLAFCYTAQAAIIPPIAYTTNLQLDDLTGGKAWVVWEHEDEPLSVEHGGPARLLVPHLYFWKSAKWVAGIRLLDHDQLGFWERNGYHNRGDPWLEQRYEGD
jgi:DMSO/TMAO reductase YedYZ molybdopterin-dependent catalytic subunit